VTYREVDLLIDDRCSASRQLQRVAEVVIHELAHQWFGNLVTMEWCVLGERDMPEIPSSQPCAAGSKARLANRGG